MASEVMKLIFAVLDVSFNSGYYTFIIKRQFLYINIIKEWNAWTYSPLYMHVYVCWVLA